MINREPHFSAEITGLDGSNSRGSIVVDTIVTIVSEAVDLGWREYVKPVFCYWLRNKRDSKIILNDNHDGKAS